MKIVVEYLFIESFFVCFVVLKSTALWLREKAKFVWLSAGVNAVATVLLPMFRLSRCGAVLFNVGLFALNVCISFKWKSLKRFFQLFASVFVCNFLYGGVCYYFERLFGIDTIFVLPAVVGITFVFARLANRLCAKNKAIQQFKVKAVLSNGENNVECFAFLDSGNFLSDNLTDKPVSLINWKVFQQLYPQATVAAVFDGNLSKVGLKNAHYIDFGTLNGKNQILVFEVERLTVGESVVEKVMMGLSTKDFAFDSDVILHNNFASFCV